MPSWRNRIIQSSEITSPKEIEVSLLHGRVLSMIELLASQAGESLGIPGEEHIRTLLARQARKRLANVDETTLHDSLAKLEDIIKKVREGNG